MVDGVMYSIFILLHHLAKQEDCYDSGAKNILPSSKEECSILLIFFCKSALEPRFIFEEIILCTYPFP